MAENKQKTKQKIPLNFGNAENAKENSLWLLWVLIGFFMIGFFIWLGTNGPERYEEKKDQQKTPTEVIN